jgi:CheY-like chemotaxis protein
MPSMSGIALASQLSLLSPALSLIALSVNELIADQRALKEAGFLGMLAKPLSPQHLVSLITTAD